MIHRTVSELEHRPEWPRIVARLASAPLHDVAREFGVTPGAVAAAMVRTRASRKAMVVRGTPVTGSVEPGTSTEPAAASAPTSTAEFFPPEPTAAVRAPGKLDAHMAADREAVGGGDGPAFLGHLHRLVRVNLRSRIASTGDEDLLARFDLDLPARPTPPGARPSALPAPNMEARQAPQEPFLDAAPGRRPSSHIFVVTVLLDDEGHEYGVLAESMMGAVTTAVRATGTGVVVAIRRELPALV